MKAALRAVPALAATCVLYACATGPADTSPPAGFEDDPRLGQRVDQICFGRSINSFGETTRRTIVLEARVRDYYLVETYGTCQDLDWAQSVSLDQFSSCLSRGDAIVPYDSVFGPRETDFRSQRCQIKAIYEWDPDAAEAEGDAADEPAPDTR